MQILRPGTIASSVSSQCSQFGGPVDQGSHARILFSIEREQLSKLTDEERKTVLDGLEKIWEGAKAVGDVVNWKF